MKSVRSARAIRMLPIPHPRSSTRSCAVMLAALRMRRYGVLITQSPRREKTYRMPIPRKPRLNHSPYRLPTAVLSMCPLLPLTSRQYQRYRRQGGRRDHDPFAEQRRPIGPRTEADHHEACHDGDEGERGDRWLATADERDDRHHGADQQQAHGRHFRSRLAERRRQCLETGRSVSLTIGNGVGEVDRGGERTPAEEQDQERPRRTARENADPERHQRERDGERHKTERGGLEPEIVSPPARGPKPDKEQREGSQGREYTEQEGAHRADDRDAQGGAA